MQKISSLNRLSIPTSLLMLSLLACAHRPPAQTAVEATDSTSSEAIAPKTAVASPSIKSLWDFGNPAATEARFLTIAQISPPQDKAIYLTQAARAQGLQGKFDEGHKTLDGLLSSLSTFSPEVQVRYNLERGRLYNSANKIGLAKPHFQEAWEIGSDSGLAYLAIDAVHMLGIAYKGAESVSYNNLGLKMAQESEDPKAQNWQGPLLNNLGWTYIELEQFEDALTTFQASQSFREGKNQEVPTLLAIYSVAHALRQLARCEESLLILEPAQLRWVQMGPQDGYTEAEIALCEADLDRDEAAQSAATALTLLKADPWVVENEKTLLTELEAVMGTDPE